MRLGVVELFCVTGPSGSLGFMELRVELRTYTRGWLRPDYSKA